MTEPVRIALVGMGWWGKKMLQVLQAAPGDIRVVRAVEPNRWDAEALLVDLAREGHRARRRTADVAVVRSLTSSALCVLLSLFDADRAALTDVICALARSLVICAAWGFLS